MSAVHRVPVIEVGGCGSDTATVKIERPEGYEYRAGQWFRVTVDTEEGPQTRTLSIASAPADEWLEFTTRLSPSPFKQAVARLRVGDGLEIGNAAGRLRLPDGECLVLLVGGIGVTPIRSLLREAIGSGRAFDDALLVYGNRDIDSECYIDEFMAMESSGVRVVRVLERPPAGWGGESGFITDAMVRKYWPSDDGRPFVVTGPPVMVAAMATVLESLGVDKARTTVESLG